MIKDKHIPYNQIMEFYFGPVVISEIEKHYNESHRYYHNLEHIKTMLYNYEYLVEGLGLTLNEKRQIELAIIFHDIIYDPTAKTNEEDSAELCMLYLKGRYPQGTLDDIRDLILLTKRHIPEHFPNLDTRISNLICALDLFSFTQEFEFVLKDRYNIFKEYQFVDHEIYKAESIKILNNFLEHDFVKNKLKDYYPWSKPVENIRNLIQFIQFWQPKIGVFPGTFKPTTIGHIHIRDKATKVFDKVIMAYGQNTLKDPVEAPIPEYLKYIQTDRYNGTLVEYINSKSYPVTIVRGIRNFTDINYEQNFYTWLKEMGLPEDVEVVEFLCDKEFEHISSSDIKSFQARDMDVSKYIV